jgi:VanZ family protein
MSNKDAGFTIVAILTLAVGIAVSAALLSAMNGTLRVIAALVGLALRMACILFGISAHDLLTSWGAVLLLILVALRYE